MKSILSGEYCSHAQESGHGVSSLIITKHAPLPHWPSAGPTPLARHLVIETVMTLWHDEIQVGHLVKVIEKVMTSWWSYQVYLIIFLITVITPAWIAIKIFARSISRIHPKYIIIYYLLYMIYNITYYVLYSRWQMIVTADWWTEQWWRLTQLGDGCSLLCCSPPSVTLLGVTGQYLYIKLMGWCWPVDVPHPVIDQISFQIPSIIRILHNFIWTVESLPSLWWRAVEGRNISQS